jgi:hypothetical protein
MTTKMRVSNAIFEDGKTKNLKFFLGSDRDITQDQIWEQTERAFEEVRAGQSVKLESLNFFPKKRSIAKIMQDVRKA